MASAAIIFIVIFYTLLLIPCIGISWLGSKLIEKLGRYPSKTPAIQLSVMLKLAVVEVVSFALLLTFFKALVSE
jgi:hypothetical protein